MAAVKTIAQEKAAETKLKTAELEKSKTAAKKELTTKLDDYTKIKDMYSAENRIKLGNAETAGEEAITKATTNEEITLAKTTAINAMAAIAKKGMETLNTTQVQEASQDLIETATTANEETETKTGKKDIDLANAIDELQNFSDYIDNANKIVQLTQEKKDLSNSTTLLDKNKKEIKEKQEEIKSYTADNTAILKEIAKTT
jgi:hypothetical protein